MTTTNSPDWPEDFEKENGSYNNQCVNCNRVFTGLKGRKTCKSCVEAFEAQQTPTTAVNPAKLLNDFFRMQKVQAFQRAEQKYVNATVGKPMNRKERRANGMRGKKK